MSDKINNISTSKSLKKRKKADKNKIEKIINSKEEDKLYLEGELHKEYPEYQKDSNSTENNNNIPEQKPTSRQYDFLKDKMSKMKGSNNITYGINKSLDKQMKKVEADIIEHKILITEPKNLNKLISRSLQKIPTLDIEKKNRIKIIKDLQEEKNNLNNKLKKIISNENILSNEVFTPGATNSLSIQNFSPVDQNIFKDKQKALKSKKNELIDKIGHIEDKLNLLIANGVEPSRKERIKNYLENFERDKEIIEARAKKYQEEEKERNQRIAKDLNEKEAKLKKEIDDKIKEKELKKKELLKRLKDYEKAIVQKRTKMNDEKANMFKPFLKKNLKEDINDYLFSKKEEEYQQKEKNLVDKENLRRKERMKMDFNEIYEFERNAISNREKFETENAERKKKLIIEWKLRKAILPTYIYPKKESEPEEKEKENEENKKELNKALSQKRQIFSYNLKNNKQPEINPKLKKQRVDLIKSLENPKLAIKEKLLTERQKKADNLLLLDTIKNNTKIKKIKIKINDSIKRLNNSLDAKKKTKPIFLKHPVFHLHPKIETKIDYLTEKRKEKQIKILKRNALSSEKSEEEGKNEINIAKWEKVINSENGTVLENLNNVREKAKKMDEEAKMNQQFLKYNGGVKNNPEIGQKISNLLIDSIEAKLSIINKLNKE